MREESLRAQPRTSVRTDNDSILHSLFNLYITHLNSLPDMLHLGFGQCQASSVVLWASEMSWTLD